MRIHFYNLKSSSFKIPMPLNQTQASTNVTITFFGNWNYFFDNSVPNAAAVYVESKSDIGFWRIPLFFTLFFFSSLLHAFDGISLPHRCNFWLWKTQNFQEKFVSNFCRKKCIEDFSRHKSISKQKNGASVSKCLFDLQLFRQNPDHNYSSIYSTSIIQLIQFWVEFVQVHKL